MNPGGDFGKRELSPALANRFTAIWVPPIEDANELGAILHAHIAGAGPSTLFRCLDKLGLWAGMSYMLMHVRRTVYCVQLSGCL